MTSVPYDTRQLAIKAFTSSYKASLALLKKGYIKHFELKFLTKKDRSDVFYINKRALTSDLKIFKRKLKNPKINLRKKAKQSLLRYIRESKTISDGDFPIIRDSAGRYYLCIVQKIHRTNKNINSDDGIVALDPGVRTFQTYFSQKEFGTIGDGINMDIRKINDKIERLEALKAKSKSKTRYNLKRRCLKSRSKITNKVNDLHWKAVSFLTRRYKVIFLPIFKTKQMTSNSPNKKTNREMYNLAHYKFKMRLKHKAKINGCRVIDCCESYTSKTCTNCGELNDVGSKKIYECAKCNCKIDRDLNGARNIFIRCLTKQFS
jgi:putative transposase